MLESDLTGQTLGGYTLVSKIGRGGMATVYKAYEPALDRYVAIKILPPSLALEAGFSERFAREAKAIAKLDHPNILPIYSYGQHSGLSYLVMRYVQAGTLKDLMHQPLALPYIAELIHQIGDALQYAHDNGIIHRDIKPSNILMANPRWALLTDFGLAKMMQSTGHLTGTGVGVGTPAYMSPEQAQGFEVDGRTDVYSLGVMLYELVIGKVPYEAETPMAVVLKHISAPLPLPSEAKPDLPEEVESVILKALAKNPDDRFQSVAALVEALDKAVAHAADARKPAPQPEVSVAPSIAPPAAMAPPSEPTLGPIGQATVLAPIAQPAAQETIAAIPAAADKRGGPPKVRARQLGAGLIVLLLVITGLVWGFGQIPTTKVANTPTKPATATVANSAPPSATPTVTNSATPAPTPTPTKPSFIIRLRTSSDWFTASLITDGTQIRSSKLIDSSGQIGINRREVQQFIIDQSLNIARLGYQISATHAVVLMDSNALKSLTISMDSGCLGNGQVEILNAQVDPPVVVFRASIFGCRPEFAEVPIELIKTTSPRAVAAMNPAWPILPAQAGTRGKYLLTCPDQEKQLCTIEATSGGLTQLTRDFNYELIADPSWSPNGQQIYYSAVVKKDSPWTTHVMNTDGSGSRKLVDGIASLSPDGQTLAYTNWLDCGTLRLINPDGTNRRFLNTPGVQCIHQLHWSPDGTRLVFADLFDFDNRPPSVWVINRDGSNLQKIYQFETVVYAVYNIGWNPDGKSVGLWFEVKVDKGITGYLLNAITPSDPQPIEWDQPPWWTPSFWPQWGITR